MPESNDIPEPVWTFRGYQIRASEFTTAMSHFFRAEITRANVWRQRLDTTTNWAVIATGAVISFAFNATLPGSHSVIILNTLLVTLFLFIEARRYRYYELWSYRVRLMETDFFAAMLVPPFRPSPDWSETLADNLLHPDFSISMWEALGRRLRRNYMPIYFILGIAWALKIALHPTAARSWDEFVARAAIGALPGGLVLLVGVIFNGALMLMGLLTFGLHQATGEVLPSFAHELDLTALELTGKNSQNRDAWFRPSKRRHQFLTLIISSRAQEVAEKIMTGMRRGVTGLNGTGMFTGESRTVLMCAVTATEVAQLKALVSEVDPQGFVVIAPAQEVLGKGFLPLNLEKQ